MGEDSYTEIKIYSRIKISLFLSLNREEWISFLFYGRKLCISPLRKGGEKACSGTGKTRLLIKEASPPVPGAHKPQRKERTQLLELNTKSNQAAPDNILSQALLLTLAFQFKVAEKPSAQKCAFLSWLWATFLHFDKWGR